MYIWEYNAGDLELINHALSIKQIMHETELVKRIMEEHSLLKSYLFHVIYLENLIQIPRPSSSLQ